jgi:hypothetical protein
MTGTVSRERRRRLHVSLQADAASPLRCAAANVSSPMQLRGRNRAASLAGVPRPVAPLAELLSPPTGERDDAHAARLSSSSRPYPRRTASSCHQRTFLCIQRCECDMGSRSSHPHNPRPDDEERDRCGDVRHEVVHTHHRRPIRRACASIWRQMVVISAIATCLRRSAWSSRRCSLKRW